VYLIGGQFLAELARNERLNLGRFYARRALRIMPAYLVYFSDSPMARVSGYGSAALEICVFSSKHRAARRHRVLACLVSRGGRSILSRASIRLLILFWRPRGVIGLSCVIIVAGVLLRAFLAAQNPSVDGGVSFRGFQAWICRD
jgi:hypothetical protein